MKILISAYACEPNKGSEPEVGWSWVNKLSENNEVFVITRSNNRINIEKELEKNIYKDNIEFIYYDLPKLFLMIKKITKFNQGYYLLWQIGTINIIKKIVKNKKIDIAHHITFVNYKLFTGLVFAKVPLILGPVGGGERAPINFYKKAKLKVKIKEFIRDLDICMARINPIIRYTWKKAKKILVTTPETLSQVPKKYLDKVEIMQAISIEENSKAEYTKVNNQNEKFRILYVGNLLYLKGIYILIESFYKLSQEYPNVELVICGDGEEKAELIQIINEYNIQSKVVFKGKLSRNEVLQQYSKSSVFAFPSLHDSGGLVVLEAMANGTPTICLNRGGPSVNVIDNLTGIIVDAENYEQAIEKFYSSFKELIENRDIIEEMGRQCLINIGNYSIDKKIERVQELYKECKNK